MFVIRIDHLQVAFPGNPTPTWALDDISLEHRSGAFSVVGPSGSGKTTLLRVLATQLEPTSGRAWVGGYDVAKTPLEVRRRLGYVPQAFGLPGDLSLEEYLVELALLEGLGDEAPDRAFAAMVTVHLQGAANRRLKAFSGGMKRRAMLAQALMRNPSILLVDAPTDGLDPFEQITVLELLRSLSETCVVLMATHHAREALALPGRVGILKSGRLLANLASSELQALAQHRVFLLPWSFRDKVGGLVLPFRDPRWIVVISDDRPHEVAREMDPTPEHGYLYVLWRTRQEVAE